VDSVNKRKNRRRIYALIFFFVFTLFLYSETSSFFWIPNQQWVTVGESLNINLSCSERILHNLSIQVQKNKKELLNYTFCESAPALNTPGQFDVILRFLGIPVRHMVVNVIPPVKVIPGGQSIGILIHSKGVIVAGHALVKDLSGREFSPAAEAGVRVGDVILKINDKVVNSDIKARELIEEAGKRSGEVLLLIKRDNKKFHLKVKSVFSIETRRYMLGLLIRDSAAGVGTLTFYEPETWLYGALGHLIANVGTVRPIDMSDGRIVGAAIEAIHPGVQGRPGEKIGLFKNEYGLLGNIDKNTPFGIFGKLNRPVRNPYYLEPIPVAMSGQIHEGPAHILTVLHDERIEKFSVRIQRVMPQLKPDGKGLVIKVTDKRLLSETGGIIQGMSGSPIIQDGKLVGAVTHVFINEPAKGYGVLAEWMLREIDMLDKNSKKKEISALSNIIHNSEFKEKIITI